MTTETAFRGDEFPPEWMEAARLFLRAFIGDRVIRPSDLDEVLIGRMQNPFNMYGGQGRTPFSVGLSLMMESGDVIAGEDDGGWWYRLEKP